MKHVLLFRKRKPKQKERKHNEKEMRESVKKELMPK
jgi:hypothetical protein